MNLGWPPQRPPWIIPPYPGPRKPLGEPIPSSPKNFLAAGARIMGFALALMAGIGAAHVWTTWLFLPAFLLIALAVYGLWTTLPAVCGIVEAFFYAGVASVLAGSLLEGSLPYGAALVCAGIFALAVATAFISTTYSMWKSERPFG